MAYLDSERISSYPSTKRASVNKLITENTVTRVINRLIDKESYVITNGLRGVDFSTDIPVVEWGLADFEFVIHGYYFCITPDEASKSGLSYLLSQVPMDRSLDPNSEHTLYARIFIDKIDKNFPELYGQEDVAESYRAIQFFWDNQEVVYPDGDPETKDFDFYDAPLVRHMSDDAGTTWGNFVPLTSLFRFVSQAIENIDGGEVIL